MTEEIDPEDVAHVLNTNVDGLDFSIFHPLDHRLGNARCRSFPGGSRQHLVLWWEYQCRWRPDVLWHKVLCRTGHHDIRGGQSLTIMGREVQVQRSCVWCRCKPEETGLSL